MVPCLKRRPPILSLYIFLLPSYIRLICLAFVLLLGPHPSLPLPTIDRVPFLLQCIPTWKLLPLQMETFALFVDQEHQ